MHHGYYGADGKEKKERRQAQIDLIEELLIWGLASPHPQSLSQAWERDLKPLLPFSTPGEKGLGDEGRSVIGNEVNNILDVGCGIGGSSLYLGQKFNATVTGITLSPVQAARATERAAAAKISDRTNFLVADAQSMPFADNSFDLVWSLESGEHMPDKEKFLQECYRVLKPGGTLLMATWCHRPTTEKPLTPDEQKHLEKIYRVYCLPYVISLPEYEAIARHLSFHNISTADWSAAVAPFWDIVISSALNPSAIVGLCRSGWKTIQAALSLKLMSRGYDRGLIEFGLLRANK
ncbi:MAG: methyltransferase domain-containing protein [Cyanosarcina radialis HA8281-LM2]|nr:methyltransferase domain-containing protein [Cyanosarcina radialis HA8281-LM2]